jgi:hypothetical protein
MKVAKKRSNKIHLEDNGRGKSLISWKNIARSQAVGSKWYAL